MYSKVCQVLEAWAQCGGPPSVREMGHRGPLPLAGFMLSLGALISLRRSCYKKSEPGLEPLWLPVSNSDFSLLHDQDVTQNDLMQHRGPSPEATLLELPYLGTSTSKL